MLSKSVTWVKTHRLICLLGLVIVYLLWRSSIGQGGPYPMMQTFDASFGESYSSDAGMGMAPPVMSDRSMKIAPDQSMAYPQRESTTPGGARMVSRDADMSIVVQRVGDSIQSMISLAEQAGGFMVSSSQQNPGETGNGYFVVRVPTAKLDEVMDAYRRLGMKVTSESVQGTDITDQYTDVQAHLRPLRDTYAQFDQLRVEAKTIEEKMQILTQLQNLQHQIDSLVGQEKYLSSISTTSRISVSLSTDEYQLPYAPEEGWRPEVIWKMAVRDLVRTIRGYSAHAIYVLVYAVIWVPALLIGWLIYWIYKKTHG